MTRGAPPVDPWSTTTGPAVDWCHGGLREIAGYAGAADPQGLAEEMALLMEGAYVTRQVTGRDETAKTVRRLVDPLLDRHLGAAPAV